MTIIPSYFLCSHLCYIPSQLSRIFPKLYIRELAKCISVYDTCSKLGTFRKWLGSTVCVLVINGSIISIHSILKRSRSYGFYITMLSCCVCLLSLMWPKVDNLVADKFAATSCNSPNISA
jgi:hypothetical protein